MKMDKSFAVMMALVVITMSGAGCRSTTTFVAAIACQGFSRPVQDDPADGWSFRGLNHRVRPRVRPGTYASSTYGVRFLNADKLGPHSYWYRRAEKNGIVYICRGGHIDVAHLRKAADWTGYLAAVTLDHIKDNHTEFVFKLREPTRYHVTISYPDNWQALPLETRQEIGRVVAIEAGQYLAFVGTTWHEILTWFGYRTRGYETDFPSAFSWEDNYSNLLGTYVGVAALEDPERPFSEAATVALSGEMAVLVPLPGKTARALTESVRNEWFGKRWLVTEIRKRNLDLGLDDGLVSPVLIPSASDFCDTSIQPLAVPTLAAAKAYGFSVHVEIEPREWERGRIWTALGAQNAKDRRTLNPEAAFPKIMAYIADEAVQRYGFSL